MLKIIHHSHMNKVMFPLCGCNMVAVAPWEGGEMEHRRR